MTIASLNNAGANSEDIRQYRRVQLILREELSEVLVQDMIEFAAERFGDFDSPAYIQLLVNMVTLEESMVSPVAMTDTCTAPHTAPF